MTVSRRLEVLSLGALELVEHYRAGELSPLEVLDASLAQIDEHDPVINAFCLVDPERARAEARESERRWRDRSPAGALDGVPVAIKDVFLTAGWPTVRGSRAIDPAGPWEDDAPVVAALRRHGAVLPGKTTTPEFGWKAVTDSPLTGVTSNPWDPTRTPGGSSGGSAAALAAGMVPLALGTDGGGSIRIPCSFCGLPGIKATYGRVPAWPASPFGVLSHAGPMARTVADLAALLAVLAEPDPRDWSALEPPAHDLADVSAHDINDLRVAFSPNLGYATVDPEVAALVAAAANVFERLGAHVDHVDPGFEDPRRCYDVLWSTGAAKLVSSLGDPPPDDLLDPGALDIVRSARKLTALEYVEALRVRDALGIRMSLFHQEWDLLLTPTVAIPAFETGVNVPAGSADPGWPSWTPFSYPFNITQQPAGSVPCGFTAAGLPVGLQIVGPRYRDALVLAAMAAYESAAPQRTIAVGP
ncbi:MAG TPA: amidase [Solirubrobacteraceae bacterium]|nr:amidase [Solirubrobacteraceae bacterium]